jgi:heme exporter protein A
MGGQGQSPLLTLKRVTCVRGGRTLFEGLDLALHAGDAALITGPNGIGKSSLLRLIAGLLESADGTVEVKCRIALAGEDHALNPQLPLAEALGFWAKLDALIAPAEAGASEGVGTQASHRLLPPQERQREALVAVAMDHLAMVPIRMLSTGQRKRATLARTIASGAVLWLLDEPGNGLDAAAIPLLEAAIAAHRASGGAVIVATHQPLNIPGAQHVALGQ